MPPLTTLAPTGQPSLPLKATQMLAFRLCGYANLRFPLHFHVGHVGRPGTTVPSVMGLGLLTPEFRSPALMRKFPETIKIQPGGAGARGGVKAERVIVCGGLRATANILYIPGYLDLFHHFQHF